MKRTWYHVALARDAGAPVLVAASGEHMGQAIAEAQAHVAGSWPVAVDHAPDSAIPLGESVGKGHVVDVGAAPDGIATFRWPTGVLPSIAGAAQLSAAGPGWTVRPNKLLVIEAQVAADQVGEVFLSLIEKLPTGDNLEVRVLDHFEEAQATDVWLTSRINTRKIIRFLDEHDEELFGNGHLELSVYVRRLKGTLRLTEHKTVVWLADGNGLEAEIKGWLGELHVPHVGELTTVSRAPHFHYRSAKSRDRKKLGEELFRQRLRKVDSLKKTAQA